MTASVSLPFASLKPIERYKLLAGLVIPRPIALVTTVGPGGVVNAAPFSFFNAFSEDPPLVVLGVQSNPDGSLKDTSSHIRDSGAFVVNLVDEALGERMNTCAVDFPRDISEIEMSGLATVPGVAVPVPHIVDSPASFECRHYKTLEVSALRQLIIGEIVHLHARPGVVDPVRMYVNLDEYKPLARLFGNLYAPLGEPFDLTRQSYGEWKASNRAAE
jgi:flavin reductase (DIM6/NTAB) family NADH-FMN oxidoreductase RutF